MHSESKQVCRLLCSGRFSTHQTQPNAEAGNDDQCDMRCHALCALHIRVITKAFLKHGAYTCVIVPTNTIIAGMFVHNMRT